MSVGLTSKQVKRIQEFLVIANDLQLVQVRLLISSEIDRREKIKNWLDKYLGVCDECR